jgi:hypothetical protein
MWFRSIVVSVTYATPELRSRLDVVFNEIHEVHQPNMNM